MMGKTRPFNISLKIGIFLLAFLALSVSYNQDVFASVGNWQKDPFEIRGFINSKADQFGFNKLPNSSAPLFDATTAQQICEWAGFDTVLNMDCKSRFDGRCGYHSCGDNQLARWDSSTNRFEIKNACKQGNKWLATLVCGNACTSHASKKCVGNSVYWFDSCGKQQELVQTCSASQVCQNAQCLNIACSSSSQCGTDGFVGGPFCSNNDVYQNYTTYTCQNPGTVNSTCTQITTPRLLQLCQANQACNNGKCENITCKNNSDCGTDSFTGGPFCQGNNVYKNLIKYTCNNPGTTKSFCTNNTEAVFQQTCQSNQVCSSGNCQNINCFKDLDCGVSGSTGGPFCQNNNVYKNFTTYTCNNPGTANSFCSNKTNAQLIQACLKNQVCSNGTCQNIACSSNSDCGIDRFLNEPFCLDSSKDVYRQYITFTCNNPGTINSSCNQFSSPRLIQTCLNNQACSSGSCQNIACSSNSDCGADGFTGSPFCQNNGVYKNFTTYTCNNSGTTKSFCTNKTEARLQQTCQSNQVCSSGNCANIACQTNSQCGTDGFIEGPFCQGNSVYRKYLTYTCNNPGTINSFCSSKTDSQLVQACSVNQVCSSGNCTNVACSSNLDCGVDGFVGSPFCQADGVYRNFVAHTCQNPGTANAKCTTATLPQLTQTCLNNQTCSNGSCQNITCSSNSDCGVDGFSGGPFCQGSNVYRNFTAYNCNNPGTVNSSCTNSTTAQPVQSCSANQACTNGSCVNLIINCRSNADCGTDQFVGAPFCQGNSVYQDFKIYTCNNPGTSTSYCTTSTSPQQKQACSVNQVCSSGNCSNINIACNSNADCGTDSFTGGPFCRGNSVYRNYTINICNNPGTANSYCTNSTSEQLVQTCSANQACSSGSCSNLNIACNSNADCGANGFFGGPYCQGNSVYENFRSFICNNPGTASSYCSTSTNPQLKQTCSANQSCSGGSCENLNIACNSNSDCGTDGVTGGPFCQGNSVYENFKKYTCNNPGTATSFCTSSNTPQLKQACLANQTCSGGSCTNVNIACNSNSDCGTDGFTGGPFCQGNSIYRSYTTYTCNNPGTANSNCTNSTSSQLVQSCSANQTCSGGSCTNINIACSSNSDCGTNGFTGGAYCQGNSVYENYRTYTCNNPGTSNSYCTSSTNAQLKQTCSANQTCSGGSCTNVNIACSSNSDCGSSGYTGNPFCQGNSIYRTYTTYTCNNPGTSNSYCTNSTASQLFQTCSANQTCSNGQCSQSQLTSLTVNKNAINLSSGNLNWSNYVNASPSDILRFSITIQSSSGQEARDVVVRDILPANLTYGGNLSVTTSSGQSVSYYGDLVSGLNIGLIPSGQTVTIIYQANLAPAQNFSFGTTTLRNNVTVTAQDLTTGSLSATATVAVTRSGVLGATFVPTGFTNNPLIDFFFLPLAIALAGVWLWKSKLINFEAWLDKRRAKVKDYSATKKLRSKVEEIKRKEEFR